MDYGLCVSAGASESEKNAEEAGLPASLACNNGFGPPVLELWSILQELQARVGHKDASQHRPHVLLKNVAGTFLRVYQSPDETWPSQNGVINNAHVLHEPGTES